MALKVYGWTHHASMGPNSQHAHSVAQKTAPHHSQVRMIVAAKSAAAAARSIDRTPRQIDCGTSGNPAELAVALAHPGIVFIAPLNYSASEDDFVRLWPLPEEGPATDEPKPTLADIKALAKDYANDPVDALDRPESWGLLHRLLAAIEEAE